jgi:YD repeat-containing protein
MYGVANRLTLSGVTTYTWDNYGNLLNAGQRYYTYTVANRPITITQSGTPYAFVYNGLGDRVKQTVNGTPTNYTLDLNAGLTQVLTDTTNVYLYGNGRIAQYTGATPSYFLSDALGSVRQLTNSSGGVTLAKSYQPYGRRVRTI